MRAHDRKGVWFDRCRGHGYTAAVGAIQILIVDDDPWILRMVTTVLGKRGYRIHTAADGQEAYLKAIEVKPDLIVTDIMMPKMDGWTLVRSLRARSDLALTPVIFLSALGSDEDRIQGFRLGADDYLPKPFRFEELDLRVNNALRKRRATSDSLPRPAAPAGGAPTSLSSNPGGIQGALEQLGLSSLLVMVEMERKSGILVLRRQGKTARLFVKQGKVIAARIEGEGTRGADAVYNLLTWPDGRFDFTAVDIDMEDEIGVSTTHLLMEGARLIDEGAGKK
jgi:CheY-like chemotaxis protein